MTGTFNRIMACIMTVCVTSLIATQATWAEDQPQSGNRLVVIGPELVEITYALGAGEQIAALDKHSTYPEDTKTKGQLGYFRALSPEGIASFSPDTIITTPSAGPAETLALLKDAGITVATAPHITVPADIPALITFVATTLGKADDAKLLISTFRQKLDEARAEARGTTRVLFLLSVQSGKAIAAGAETVPAALIQMAGARNAATFEGFKPVSPEAIAEMAPEMIIMIPDRIEAIGGMEALRALPGIAVTPASRQGRILALDAGLAMRLGLRTPLAIKAIRTALEKL